MYPIEWVNVADLHPHEANYLEHPPEQIAGLIASLLEFGQVKPIVVWHRTVVAGHGVTAAAKAIGWKALQAVICPPEWDEMKVRAYLLADNELARLAHVDRTQLVMLLEEQHQAGRDLLTVGSSDEKLRELTLAEERSIDLQGKLGDTLERCPECGQIKRIKGLTK